MSNQFPGDFSLKEVNLYNISQQEKAPYKIKSLVREINIYESVFSSVLQATLLVQDIGKNLISDMPMMGQERIEIIIDSGDQKRTLNFYLYRIDGRVMQEKDQYYVMNCMSIEGLRNENYRICERVDGIKSEDLVKDILKRDSFSPKKVDVDETNEPFDMYVPNWRIFDLFQWLSKRSVPAYKKDSIGFLFYETFDGFNFKSIDNLFDQSLYPDNSVTYKYFQGNMTSIDKGLDDLERYRIINFSSPRMFDLHHDLRRGAFSHDSIYLDLNRRIYRTFRTTADDFWDNSSHLEKAKPYVSGGGNTPAQILARSSRTIYRPSVRGNFGPWEETDGVSGGQGGNKSRYSSGVSQKGKDYVDPVNKDFEKAFYRYYFLEYSQLDIGIPGDLDLRAGSVINVSIPDPRPAYDRIEEDTRFSGKYFVTATKHTILNRSELRTTVSLARDSYGGKPLPDVKVSENQVYQDGTN